VEERTQSVLDEFGTLVAAFDIAHAYDAYPEDPYEPRPVYVLCPRHGVYLTAHGCVVSHDSGPGLPTREWRAPCAE
jgi:hypothetical protein